MENESQRAVSLRRLSKFLSLLLRHNPPRFSLTFDELGYTQLGDIMRILNELPNFRGTTRADIDAVLALPGRQRFEITADGRMRALYGHSALRPHYEPVTPPAVLYHGSAPQNLAAIWREGLRSMARQYVHLAVSPDAALAIARRHTQAPRLLRVDAAQAYADKIVFYNPEPHIYLCDALPPGYLEDISAEAS